LEAGSRVARRTHADTHLLARVAVVERGEPLTGNDFLTPARRWRRLPLVVAVACGAAVSVVGVQAVWHASADQGQAKAPSAPSPIASASASAPPSGTAAAEVSDDLPAADGRPVQLPRGRSTVEGIATGYPQTLRGAVAAAVEYTRFLGPLDESQADRLARVVADPDWASGREIAFRGMRKDRQTLGLPASGVVPSGASMSFSPMAFQVTSQLPTIQDPSDQAVSATRVEVLVLAYAYLSGPAINPVSKVAVLPMTMTWTHGDWKLYSPDTTTSYTHLRAIPGTPTATALGWREFLS
jgi:hypothetical protein